MDMQQGTAVRLRTPAGRPARVVAEVPLKHMDDYCFLGDRTTFDITAFRKKADEKLERAAENDRVGLERDQKFLVDVGSEAILEKLIETSDYSGAVEFPLCDGFRGCHNNLVEASLAAALKEIGFHVHSVRLSIKCEFNDLHTLDGTVTIRYSVK